MTVWISDAAAKVRSGIEIPAPSSFSTMPSLQMQKKGRWKRRGWALVEPKGGVELVWLKGGEALVGRMRGAGLVERDGVCELGIILYTNADTSLEGRKDQSTKCV